MKALFFVIFMIFFTLIGCSNDEKYDAYFNAGGPICDASDVFLKGSCEPGSLCIDPENRVCERPVSAAKN